MAMTLETYAGKQARNYSSNPTIDVAIVESAAHCNACGGEVVNLTPCTPNSWPLPRWAHVNPTDDHYISPRPTCDCCGSDEAATASQHNWHDQVACTRCGGITGWAIGD